MRKCKTLVIPPYLAIGYRLEGTLKILDLMKELTQLGIDQSVFRHELTNDYVGIETATYTPAGMLGSGI
ncbi:MAG: hypothetical protein PVF70_07610 [Anaerolineales bacterium]|jgi:hypothetical protein